MPHVAQVNIARLLEPMDSERLATFVALLDPVNAAAEAAPGFVWRLKEADGNATSIVGFEGDIGVTAGVIINMSVWRDPATLRHFVYGDMHRAVLQRRREWFHVMREAYACCWWVPEGHEPTVAEAEAKVAHLRANGPSYEAFPLQKSFEARPLASAT